MVAAVMPVIGAALSCGRHPCRDKKGRRAAAVATTSPGYVRGPSRPLLLSSLLESPHLSFSISSFSTFFSVSSSSCSSSSLTLLLFPLYFLMLPFSLSQPLFIFTLTFFLFIFICSMYSHFPLFSSSSSISFSSRLPSRLSLLSWWKQVTGN